MASSAKVSAKQRQAPNGEVEVRSIGGSVPTTAPPPAPPETPSAVCVPHDAVAPERTSPSPSLPMAKRSPAATGAASCSGDVVSDHGSPSSLCRSPNRSSLPSSLMADTEEYCIGSYPRREERTCGHCGHSPSAPGRTHSWTGGSTRRPNMSRPRNTNGCLDGKPLRGHMRQHTRS